MQMTLIQQTLKNKFRRGQAKKIADFFRNSPHLPRLSIFGTKKKFQLPCPATNLWYKTQLQHPAGDRSLEKRKNYNCPACSMPYRRLSLWRQTSARKLSPRPRGLGRAQKRVRERAPAFSIILLVS
jgi:hypothetical protein